MLSAAPSPITSDTLATSRSPCQAFEPFRGGLVAPEPLARADVVKPRDGRRTMPRLAAPRSRRPGLLHPRTMKRCDHVERQTRSRSGSGSARRRRPLSDRPTRRRRARRSPAPSRRATGGRVVARRPERSVPLRQRQEVQEVLPSVVSAALPCRRTARARPSRAARVCHLKGRNARRPAAQSRVFSTSTMSMRSRRRHAAPPASAAATITVVTASAYVHGATTNGRRS